MKVGTRASMVTGGTIFASAFALTGLGISMHSLPMIYAGNGKVCKTQSGNLRIFLPLRFSVKLSLARFWSLKNSHFDKFRGSEFRFFEFYALFHGWNFANLKFWPYETVKMAHFETPNSPKLDFT